jgi:hypothetical protein
VASRAVRWHSALDGGPGVQFAPETQLQCSESVAQSGVDSCDLFFEVEKFKRENCIVIPPSSASSLSLFFASASIISNSILLMSS